MNLPDLCRRLEAYETPRWAIEAILDVELTTGLILDPCAGIGAIGEVCRDRDFDLEEMDIEDWSKNLPGLAHLSKRFWQRDFFEELSDLSDHTVIMNPPFTLAEAFVDHARRLNARKVICFQRQAWRESGKRRGWWDANPPARVWVCGARATCWRFDLLQCQDPGGHEACANAKRRGKKLETQGCAHCLGGAPTSHAWYVWERNHKGAEVTSAIYPSGDE